MAGTTITKQQNINTNNNNITTLNNSCLWLQQTLVAESKSNQHKDRPMQQITTQNCHNSKSSTTTTTAIAAATNHSTLNTYCNRNNNNNYKQTPPFTLSTAALIMSLSIVFMQMPTLAYTRSIYAESPSLAALSLDSLEAEGIDAQPEIESKRPSKLILSLFENEQDEDMSDSSAARDILTSLDVLRHVESNREYQKERRMRVRKRHTGDLIIKEFLHEHPHKLEWKNPCNVAQVNTNVEAQRVSRQQVYQYLKKFENDLFMEYDFINATAKHINIDDIDVWSKHDEVYTFLPKLTANGSIALSRWYRNMQVYVASFGYLARTQYKFDQKKQVYGGDISQELNKLLMSARFILCELETTINGSSPNNNLKKLKTITRRAMNSRLNFVTKHQLANMAPGEVMAANTVDLKFAKYSYFQYLQHMHKILRHKLESKSKKYGSLDYNNNNSSDKSVNTVIVGDDNSSIDFNSIFKSDSSLSLAESIELLLKTTTKKPHHAQRRRQHKRKNA